jgi:hypothetical protein
MEWMYSEYWEETEYGETTQQVHAKDWKTWRGVTLIHQYLEENHIEKPVIIYTLSYFLHILVQIW